MSSPSSSKSIESVGEWRSISWLRIISFCPLSCRNGCVELELFIFEEVAMRGIFYLHQKWYASNHNHCNIRGVLGLDVYWPIFQVDCYSDPSRIHRTTLNQYFLLYLIPESPKLFSKRLQKLDLIPVHPDRDHDEFFLLRQIARSLYRWIKKLAKRVYSRDAGLQN